MIFLWLSFAVGRMPCEAHRDRNLVWRVYEVGDRDGFMIRLRVIFRVCCRICAGW
jgi:hypothetical protein